MILVLSDIITVSAAFFLALLLRFGGVVDVARYQWTTLSFLYIVTLGLFYFLDFLYNLDYNNVDRLSLIKGRKFIILSLKEGQIWFQKIS